MISPLEVTLRSTSGGEHGFAIFGVVLDISISTVNSLSVLRVAINDLLRFLVDLGTDGVDLIPSDCSVNTDFALRFEEDGMISLSIHAFRGVKVSFASVPFKGLLKLVALVNVRTLLRGVKSKNCNDFIDAYEIPIEIKRNYRLFVAFWMESSLTIWRESRPHCELV